ADKEGFLRSETSLIQTIGRSARNVNAEVFLYADTVTDSMARAMEETNRRREIQIAHNKKHGITPRSTTRKISGGIEAEVDANRSVREAVTADEKTVVITKELIAELEKEMLTAAENLEFEKAASLRDKVAKLSDRIGEPLDAAETKPETGRGKRGRRSRGGGRRSGNKKGERIPKPAGSSGR
ncbi:MAG: UvrB/UvrC motif-containing protein, partial [Planctomycetota bacterium]